MARTPAVLLINLGSPDAPDEASVRRYLAEFLSDPRVIDLPRPLRWLLLRLIILPRRPRASAQAYRAIWTAEGSPLVVHSQRLAAALKARVESPVYLAMRYGNPSLAEVLGKIAAAGHTRLFAIPLYPHHAASSYETVTVEVQRLVRRHHPQLEVTIQPPFYRDPAYVEALAATLDAPLERGYDHLLFSFHGIPERHLRKADPNRNHCLVRPDCCEQPNPAHAVCYRHQVRETTRRVVELRQVPQEKWSQSFQSRLGRTPWLAPYTDHELIRLAQAGVQRLVVVCPSFVSDCLETLEELGIRGRESFRAAGGEELTLVPCLNEEPLWIDALTGWIRHYLGAPSPS